MSGDSDMPHAVVLCGEFLLHTPCCFMWGVSLTHHLPFYVGSFSYPLHAIFCGEFLLHGLSSFIWGITHSVLLYVVGFFYIIDAFFMQEVSLTHTLCCFLWVVSLTLLMLCLVSIFYYTLDASFSEEFLLHS